MLLLLVTVTHAGELEFDFDIPPAEARSALVEFARQANIQLLFAYDSVSTVQLNGLSGRYTVKEGVEALIAGSCLMATFSAGVEIQISEQKKGFWFMRNDKCQQRRLASVIPLAIAALTGAPVIYGQNAQPVQFVGLEEIIVTAQKREERLQNVPISITAITSAELDARGISSIEGLDAIAPNVLIRQNPGQRLTSTVSIRGAATTNPAVWIDPLVGLYVDGVYLGKSVGSIFDVIDIERVEVLRGPQGTLFGRNTEAGAINFVTRKPSGEFQGKVRAEAGKFSHRAVQLNLDLPQLGIASTSIALRKYRRDGWMKNLTGSDLDQRDDKAARLAVNLDFNDRLNALYAFDYSYADNTPIPASLYSTSGWRGDFSAIFGSELGGAIENAMSPYITTKRPSKMSTNHPVYRESAKSRTHSLIVTYDLSPQDQLKYIFAKRKLDFANAQDNDGTPLVSVEYAPGMTWGLRGGGDKVIPYDQDSHELQWIGSRNNLHYVAGLYYFTDDGRLHSMQDFSLLAQPFVNVDAQTRTKSKAIFGQVDYDVTDQWTVTLGLRRTEERKSGWSHKYLVDGFAGPFISDTAPGMLPRISYSKTFSSTTPVGAIAYRPTDNVTLYGRVAKGFKSGGFSAEVADPRVASTPFSPEESVSVEGGIKTTMLDNRVFVNVAIFQTKTTDQQVNQLLPGTVQSIIVNAGKSTYKGAELEAKILLTDDWKLSLNYGYLDAKYDKFIDNAFLPPAVPGGPVGTGGPLIDTASNRLPPYAPKDTLNVMIDGTFLRTAHGRFHVTVDTSYVSKTYMFPVNKSLFAANAGGANLVGIDTLPALKNINGRISWEGIPVGDGELALSLIGQNLTNEKKRVQGIDFTMYRTAYWQEPRTYFITATYQW